MGGVGHGGSCDIGCSPSVQGRGVMSLLSIGLNSEKNGFVRVVWAAVEGVVVGAVPLHKEGELSGLSIGLI